MEFILVAIQVLLNLLMLLFLFHYIYRTYKPMHTPIMYKEFIELQDNIADLTLELEKISKRSNDDLEKKIMTLEKLIQTADRKIDDLKKVIERKPLVREKMPSGPLISVATKRGRAFLLPSTNNKVIKQPSLPAPNKISRVISSVRSVSRPSTETSYIKITEMASKGKSTKEIAKVLKMNEGEVQLVLNLQSRNLL